MSGANPWCFSQAKRQHQKTATLKKMSLEDEQDQQSETEKEETNVVDSMEDHAEDDNNNDTEDETIPEEDPEITALKEEIASLENTLKEVRRKLAYTTDLADDFTKTGYARKVAEMENMRRARSVRLFFLVRAGMMRGRGNKKTDGLSFYCFIYLGITHTNTFFHHFRCCNLPTSFLRQPLL
jgi:hypothetical protein